MKIQGDYCVDILLFCEYVLEGDEVSGLYLNLKKKKAVPGV